MKRLLKRFSVIGLVIFIVGFASNAKAEKLTIVGTGSGTAILKAIAEAFHQKHPDITVEIPPSIGSGGGVKAVGRDEYALGRVARKIKDKEKPYGLTYIPYAKIPVVFYTNKSVSVKGLSSQQILDIYQGEITDWEDVGGQKSPIRVVTREKGDSSRSVLEKNLTGFKGLAITTKAKTTFSDPETEKAVLNVTGCIAYGSYSNIKKIDVNVLGIDGQGAEDNDYPYNSELGFIFKPANNKGSLKLFVDFATSKEAVKAIRGAGGVPLSQ